MTFKKFGLGVVGAMLAGTSVQAGEAITFGTNWVPQAEHGGFYQAVADGTYADCGLDVTIVPGGPNVNNRALLLAGKIDFLMDGNLLQPFNSAAEDIPMVVVSAIFQKEPQIIMTHPGQGLDTWESLKTAETLLIGNGGYQSFYRWMVSTGFRDEQRKPYTYNSAPFLSDLKSGQQGYVTSEPYAIQTNAGFEPNVFLLADNGFDTYSTLIATMKKMVDEKPEVVQCFVDGSAIGWYNYLYGDATAANEMIKAGNAELGDANIEFAREQIVKYGIVDSGESEANGIGAMSMERIASFYDKMVAADVIEAGLDYESAIDLSFVNKGVGLDVKAKLLGN
ncbi:NitT/TauT family transport system substrate-binding protein [Sulfitobacter undariae]|uniref:NitT/TauT family transport system substrate-binding protein n=1 Tax=Sulfitobacter undariae TaxID=1563671 RepID=A0A7W6H2D4_9RHOB|nr:ABC transporter substrate-binding protein [Sulfitobacter undariae]MBB3995718.1 NitT/TauT family transport system substrate-binding protein [Sulfitobacter undariae]